MTRKEYERELEQIELTDYLAEMSDDFNQWRREKAMVAEWRKDLEERARKAGII